MALNGASLRALADPWEFCRLSLLSIYAGRSWPGLWENAAAAGEEIPFG